MAFAPPIALDYLRRAHVGGRLGHAYLLTGGPSATDLATQLAALVVGAPATSVLTNPDVHVIEPESKSRRIMVDQTRDLENALRLRASAAGGRKVGIIFEADRLNAQASNAFLKTLEEPPAGSLLLLVSAQPETLLETILSRCIKVTLQAPDEADITRSPEEAALREMLERHARAASDSTVAVAYRLLREFNGLLAAVRSRLQADADAALEREETHYAQTTDGTWLAEREGYYKSLTEARYTAGRALLLETLARWWGDALRRTMTEADLTDATPHTTDILRRLTAIEELRENLDRNIQEALALEVAFLQIFGS